MLHQFRVTSHRNPGISPSKDSPKNPMNKLCIQAFFFSLHLIVDNLPALCRRFREEPLRQFSKVPRDCECLCCLKVSMRACRDPLLLLRPRYWDPPVHFCTKHKNFSLNHPVTMSIIIKILTVISMIMVNFIPFNGYRRSFVEIECWHVHFSRVRFTPVYRQYISKCPSYRPPHPVEKIKYCIANEYSVLMCTPLVCKYLRLFLLWYILV